MSPIITSITRAEVSKAIDGLKNNKAVGLDDQADMLKHGNDGAMDMLTYLFNLIWYNEEVPNDGRRGVIVTSPKRGCLGDCNT